MDARKKQRNKLKMASAKTKQLTIATFHYLFICKQYILVPGPPFFGHYVDKTGATGKYILNRLALGRIMCVLQNAVHESWYVEL